MIKKSIQVKNKMGVHARPAAMVAQLASKFASDIMVAKGGIEVNAKSIMGIMMLAAECGSMLMFTIEGKDEAEAFSAMEELFNSQFSEGY
ncbi:phosphocarrier protein [Elusimicrobium simillimum]|uniref:HPr family phosphocarrier protein n=1 Tax=Elusimicrobium simillimum TaxID=3143438 RepID=UPI003C6F9EEE